MSDLLNPEGHAAKIAKTAALQQERELETVKKYSARWWELQHLKSVAKLVEEYEPKPLKGNSEATEPLKRPSKEEPLRASEPPPTSRNTRRQAARKRPERRSPFLSFTMPWLCEIRCSMQSNLS
jgi:hypothetical protein